MSKFILVLLILLLVVVGVLSVGGGSAVVVAEAQSNPPTDGSSTTTAAAGDTVVWCADTPALQMIPYEAVSYTTEDLSKGSTNFTIIVQDSSSNLFIREVESSGRVEVEGAALVSVVFYNLTQIYVALSLGDDVGISLFKTHSVTVRISAESFMCAGTSTTSNAPAQAPYTYQKTEALVNSVQQETTTAVATTAGAVSGVASSSTLATQTARASLVLSLTQCKFSHHTALDSSASPTGYRFGSSAGGYYRGGIVGNLCVMLGFGLLLLFSGVSLFAASAHYRSLGPTAGIPIALERVHFPGILVVPFATLLPGTAMCAMALLLHGADKELDILLGILTFAYLLGVIGFFAFRLTKGFGAVWVPDSVEDSDGVIKEGAELPWLHRTFHGTNRWSDGGENFKNAYGTLFADYRENFRWFIVVELGITVVAGILDGIRPTSGGCLNVGIGVLVCNFLITLPALFLRPCATLYNTSHFIVNTMLTLISSIFLVVSQVGKGDDNIALITTWISTVTIYLAFIKAGIDALLSGQKIFWAYKAHSKKKQQLLPQLEDGEEVKMAGYNDVDGEGSVTVTDPLLGEDTQRTKEEEGGGATSGDRDSVGSGDDHDEGDPSTRVVNGVKGEKEDTPLFGRTVAPLAAAKYSSPNAAQNDLRGSNPNPPILDTDESTTATEHPLRSGSKADLFDLVVEAEEEDNDFADLL